MQLRRKPLTPSRITLALLAAALVRAVGDGLVADAPIGVDILAAVVGSLHW